MKRTPFLLLLAYLMVNGIFGQVDPSIATNIIQTELAKKYISDQDLKDIKIIDNFTSKGINHIYFKQAYQGIPIFNTHGGVHFKQDDENIISNGNFSLAIQKKNKLAGRVSEVDAIYGVANQKVYEAGNITLDSNPSKEGHRVYISEELSWDKIEVKPYYYETDKNTLELCHVFAIADVNSPDYIEFVVSTVDGRIIEENNFTVYCNFSNEEVDETHSCDGGHHHHHAVENKERVAMGANDYNVFAWPVESPNFGSRSIVNSPWLDNPIASPNGWQQIGTTTYTVSKGNNVDVYKDDNNTNSPTGGDAARVDGGPNQEFDFPWSASGTPQTYEEASLSNLFYWNNVCHDVWYNYGFDEPSGNFQEENFSGMGNASDHVNSEGFDGSGTCNANMSTPPDGSNGRMQMYLCNGRDGNFDNGVVVHEYGHGISIRMTGGPGTSSCLGNQEQMGEGWSDYFGTVMTIQPGDVGTDARPMGTWLFGQGPNGGGIRPAPYSTDLSVNGLTYDDIKTVSVPHGVGSVWATMIWDMTWALIDEYGFDPDIYNGTGGNNIAMALVIEGIKLQPCSPGFVDGRDAILAADAILNGGQNQCLIWDVFARRGLGFSASQGASTSRGDGVEAFDTPPSCELEIKLTVDKTQASPGETITYDLTVKNETGDQLLNIQTTDFLDDNALFSSATNGGAHNSTDNTVFWSQPTLAAGDSIEYQVVAQIDPNISASQSDFYDDQENGSANWSTSGQGTSWNLQNNSPYSGNSHWFAEDISSTGSASLVFDVPLGIESDSKLTFLHSYDTEATWDGGVVEISTDNGTTWIDLQNAFVAGGYNSTINNSRPAFSGNSGGYIISIIDLSAYNGQSVLIRFFMSCDQAVGGDGWYIDDVLLENLSLFVGNRAETEDGNLMSTASISPATRVVPQANAFDFDITQTNCVPGQIGATLEVVAFGGSGSYTYNWNNGETTPLVDNLADGFYTVTVSDGNVSRTATRLVTSAGGTALDVSGESRNITSLQQGSIGLTVQGGVIPYTFSWSNGETTQNLDNLSEGVYEVTVTDGALCTDVETFTVLGPANCSDEYLEVQLRPDQYQDEISLIIRDENGNTVFSKVGFQDLDNGDTYSNGFCLPLGCYDVEVVDTYGDGICKSYSSPTGFFKILTYPGPVLVHESCDYGSGETVEVCLTNSDPLIVDVTKVDVFCSGELGEAAATVSGGTGNYSYSWSNGATTSVISNLAVGTYTVTVTDGTSTGIASTSIENSQIALVSDPDNSGAGTLRSAVASGCDEIMIDLAAGTGGTITLSSPITIANDVSIMAMTPTEVARQNNGFSLVLNPGVEASLENLKFSNNTISAIIVNSAILNLNNCEFENNTPDAFINNGIINIEGEVRIKE